MRQRLDSNVKIVSDDMNIVDPTRTPNVASMRSEQVDWPMTALKSLNIPIAWYVCT